MDVSASGWTVAGPSCRAWQAAGALTYLTAMIDSSVVSCASFSGAVALTSGPSRWPACAPRILGTALLAAW